MTKYFAFCWSKYNIKINAFCPGGVYDKHNKKFVDNYSNLVPLGRMANRYEYLGPIAFLMSEASNDLNGKIRRAIIGEQSCREKNLSLVS